MSKFTIRERKALRSTLDELRTVRDLLNEAIQRAADVISEIDGGEAVIEPAAPPSREFKLEEQPIQTRQPYAVKRKGGPQVRTVNGPIRGAVAESERRAIALEVSEYMKLSPGSVFRTGLLINASPTAVKRYPNEASRAACISTILKNFGTKFGVRNVSQTTSAAWAWIRS